MKPLHSFLTMVLIAACVDAPTAAPPQVSEPLREISDGGHGGNPHFYYLPPMVPPPSYSGVFDPGLSPTVEICAMTGTTCGPVIARFTMDTGWPIERIRLLPVAQRYAVNWFTLLYHLKFATYRLTTFVGTQALGYADAIVVRRPRDLDKIDRTKFVGVVNGTILPVVFRIERGTPGSVTVAPAAATIDVGATQTFSATVRDLHGSVMSCSQNIAWSSSSAAVAVVNSAGLSTGVGSGTATIAARCEAVAGIAGLTVVGKELTWVTQPSGTSLDFYDVSGTSDSDVFLSGEAGAILHYDGSTWTPMASPSGHNLWKVWATASDDAFIAGPGNVVLHYDGSSWGTMGNITGSDGTAIWGTSGSDVFLGTWNGYVAHYDGNAWALQPTPTPHYIVDLWGSSGTDVHGVGDFGQILHYNGTSWTFSKPVGSGLALHGVFGLAANDIFAVGVVGTILHFDGTTWGAMRSGTTTDLHGVWGAASNDVYAAGDGGLILHYDGSAWTPMVSRTTVRLNGIWGSSARDVFIAGYSGVILHGTK